MIIIINNKKILQFYTFYNDDISDSLTQYGFVH
jgi:hypothetical protein